jgi:hypothetical protein
MDAERRTGTPTTVLGMTTAATALCFTTKVWFRAAAAGFPHQWWNSHEWQTVCEQAEMGQVARDGV